MKNLLSWRSFVAVAFGLAAIIAVRLERDRRRRMADPANATERTVQPTPAVTAPVVVTSEESAADAEATAVESTSRGIPRPLVAAAIAAVLLPAVSAVMNIGGGHGVAAPVAALSAEAVDTENGVQVMVRGESFTPGSRVKLSWNGKDSIEATASSDGEVIAALPMPGTSSDLVADDGSSSVSLAVAVKGKPKESGVLGATSLSRVDVNGSPFFLLGVNYPWDAYGNDFGQNAWGSYGAHANAGLDGDFADINTRGGRVARWWVFADLRAGINFAADGTPTGVQPVVYEDLNRAIEVARANGVYLNLVLFDVSMLANPNTVSGVQMGGRSGLLTDPAKRVALVNNVVKPLVQAYGAEPSILSWEVMNEPEWGISDLPSPAVDGNYQPVNMAQFWAFASSVSDIVHFNSSQDVTIGSAALKWNKVWTNAFATSRGLPALNLDFYQTHYYPWMDCCTTNDAVLGNTTWSPLTQSAALLNLDKPIVVGEIHTPAGQAGAMLDTVLANGYAGFWGWSYNASNTGDGMSVDWPSYTAWASSHASIANIPPTGGGPAPTATVTATAVPPTATNTPVPAATATKTATASAASPTKTATKAATNTATKTATKTPASGSTINFNDLADPGRGLDGQYAGVNWGTGQWHLSGPWGKFTTNSVSFTDGRTSATFTFNAPTVLTSVQAYNGGPSNSTITATCIGNSKRSVGVGAGTTSTLVTKWTKPCTAVTITSSNGWDTNLDNFILGGGSGTPAATATKTATAVPATSTATKTAVPATPTKPASSPTSAPATATGVPATATKTATPVPGTATATKTATSVPPTATKTATPAAATATATSPASTPTGVATMTVRFDDLSSVNSNLNGQYPASRIDWGTDRWFLSSPWGAFNTNSVSFDDPSALTGTLSFLTPSTLTSVQAYNGGATDSTVTLACTGNPTVTRVVTAGAMVTITTGWSANCSTVTIGSSNGWDTNFDTFVIAGTTAPTSTPAPATSTPSPTAPPAPGTTPTPAPTYTGGSPCTTNCGQPRFFCDTWSGGFCDDYRNKYTLQPVAFPGPGDPYSFDVLSTTVPGYFPAQLNDSLVMPSFTTDQEHFHTAVEDGSFGVAMLRLHRPIDLSSERHIHFDADMKGKTRNYFRVMLSPELTKRDSDDRSGDAYPGTFVQLWFRNGNVDGTLCRNYVCDGDNYPYGDAFGTDRWWEPTTSPDNVRVPVDIYLSQTSIRIYINGVQKTDATFAPLGFDKAYLYLSQASYNPCKDGVCTVADQTFHWDNVAFDGPVLPMNSLTPAGSRDVVFNAYSATSCSVRGVPASIRGYAHTYTWVTWVARLPDDGTTITPADVSCNYTAVLDGSNVVRGLEIVKR